MEIKSIYTIMHLFGAVVGAGGALYSDIVFFKAMKDKRVDMLELSFLKIMSVFVWIGLGLLIISGTGLFFTDPEKYTHSTKFIAKMTIVGILTLNGLVFHVVHIPFIKRRAYLKLQLFKNALRGEDVLLVVSGVLSLTSWIFALILGSLQTVPFQVEHILSVYVGVIAFALISTVPVLKHILTISARRMLTGIGLGIIIGLIAMYLV